MGNRRQGPVGTSWCAMHQSFLPVEVFYADNRRLNGVKSYCKPCFQLHKRSLMYNSSVKEMMTMIATQDMCAICGSGKDLDWDHDHGTGKLRGRLCRNCNTAIGLLFESPVLFEIASVYVQGR